MLKDILDKYEAAESKLLFDKASDLLTLITDEELVDLFSRYPSLFIRLTDVAWTPKLLIERKDDIKQSIELFIQTIESRNLTKDEFDAMTLDDIKGYIDSIVVKKVPALLRIINELENDTRNR